MPNYYHSEIGGSHWFKKIRPDVYLCVTRYSDSDLPEITFPDSLPVDAKEVVKSAFEIMYNTAMQKIKEAKDEA